MHCLRRLFFVFAYLCIYDRKDCAKSIAINPSEFFFMMALDSGRFVGLVVHARSTFLCAAICRHYKICKIEN